VLPYLDIPFQHAHPDTLKRMARPAAAARTLDEIAAWRSVCPDLTLRSTFIVGYPGETEAEFEFQTLLDWLDEAQLDRVGCFQYENVAGARSNDLPDHVAPEVKQDRWDRFMEKAQAISAAKLAAKVGKVLEVIVDEVDEDGATCRTKADAPEIDGNLFIDEGFEGLAPGDIIRVEVDEAGDYDLWGQLAAGLHPVGQDAVVIVIAAMVVPVVEPGFGQRGRTGQLFPRHIGNEAADGLVEAELLPGQRIHAFAKAKEAAECHHSIGNLAGNLVDHQVVDPTQMFACGVVDFGPVDVGTGNHGVARLV